MKRFIKEVAAFLLIVVLGVLCIVKCTFDVIHMITGLIRSGIVWFGERYIEKTAPVYRGREAYIKIIEKVTDN